MWETNRDRRLDACQRTKAEKIGIYKDSDYLPNLCLSFLEEGAETPPHGGVLGSPRGALSLSKHFLPRRFLSCHSSSASCDCSNCRIAVSALPYGCGSSTKLFFDILGLFFQHGLKLKGRVDSSRIASTAVVFEYERLVERGEHA